MRITIIGGTGHVGTYLVPALVEAGHQVTNVSRQERQPYQQHPAWEKVQHRKMDRLALESENRFGKAILDLQPDVVIDMICFDQPGAQQLVNALKGKIIQFLHCGTMWVHGHSTQVPTRETCPRHPFGDYGIKKAAIEAYLFEEYQRSGFPVTILHPGHIVGPGWVPVNPAGHFNPGIFRALMCGEEISLPNFGMETLHHVHAKDVAQAFIKSIENRDRSIGESFHVLSPGAVTLRGYAESVASWYGQTAKLVFLPWDQWTKTVSAADAAMTFDHIAHSPHGSIDKARAMIGYEPEYDSLGAIREALNAMSLI